MRQRGIRTVIAKENSCRFGVVLLGNLGNGVHFRERAACAAKRAISHDVNTLLVAKVNDFLLG